MSASVPQEGSQLRISDNILIAVETACSYAQNSLFQNAKLFYYASNSFLCYEACESNVNEFITARPPDAIFLFQGLLSP